MTCNKFRLLVMIVSTAQIHAQSKIFNLQLDDFKQAIKVHNIGTIEIFGTSPDAFYRSNITPMRLEQSWDYKIVLRDFNSHLELHTEELIPILSPASIQASATKLDVVDVRLGFVFFSKDPNDKRIASIYFDRNGRQGAFNNMSVLFSPDLLPMMNKVLHTQLINSSFFSFKP